MHRAVVDLAWTDWVRGRLLPFPGESWKVATSLSKAEAGVKAAGTVPAKPNVADEVARGIELQVNERWDAKGNHARHNSGRDLVDIWCARAGVELATEVLVEICKQPQAKRPSRPGPSAPYALRRDGQPWSRLREYLAAAPEGDRKRAHSIAARARLHEGESRHAVAYAFCEPAWIKEDLDAAIKTGYGTLAVLASLEDAVQARSALTRLLGDGEHIAKYQLIEEAVPHIPNLMRRLDDADAHLLIKAASSAWNAATRKPWLEIVACLRTSEADALLAEHRYQRAAPKPAKTARPKRS